MNIPEPNLDHLYQEVILDHNRRPRNFKAVALATHYAHGFNNLCGDDYQLFLVIHDGKIEDIGFQGKGCAISKASASMLTTFIKGKTVDEANILEDDFIKFMIQDTNAHQKTRVGRLSIFEGVKEFPVRVKCATLIWRTLEDALKDKREHEEH